MATNYRTALVTGASSGIGRALAIGLAQQGTTVALAARREKALDEVAALVGSSGGTALVEPLDVADTDATVQRIRDIDDRLGGLDLIIACAGVGPADPSTPAYHYENLVGPCHVNFCGAMATLTAILPRMVARRRGHISAVSSLSSFTALPGSAPYCSPKAGLSMLLDCIRLDVAPHRVAVTSINLGFVDTPMVAHRDGRMPQLSTPDRAAAHILERLPAGKAHIDFPQPLAASTRLLAALPRALREAVLRRLVAD